MRNFLVVAIVVVVLAGAAFLAYREFGPRTTPEETASGELTTGEAPATPVPDEPVAEGAADAPQTASLGQPEIRPDDRVLGEADAPVTIIEFASLTCPHCATFHTETLPELKSTYIDQGQVRLVYRDFPLDGVALRASMLARCMPEDRYFAMLDVLFRSQGEWARAQDPVAALSQIGRTAGLSQERIDSCLADEALMDEVIAGRQRAEQQFDIRSTPTLVVNGETHAGALSFEQLEDVLKSELP